MNELQTHQSECIISFFASIDSIMENMGRLSANYRPMLEGERFLTDRELAERLKVSRRTLQEYRNEGRIPYIQFGGKILYKEGDIERILQEGYRKAIR